nr:MAG TPA: hypothetical protein [Caudoviricetes sp.]
MRKAKIDRHVPVIWSALPRTRETRCAIWASVPARLPPMPG